MDPDMVRQQEEAEREALGLSPKAAPVSLPLPPVGQAVVQHPPQVASPTFLIQQESGPAPLQSRAPEQQVSLPRRMGRFVSFMFAGAMLGCGIGIVFARLLDLPPDDAKLAIFGVAGVVAIVCGAASWIGGMSVEGGRT
jgi:hypothetical protein